MSALSELAYFIPAIIVKSVDIHTHIYNHLLKRYHNIFNAIEPAETLRRDCLMETEMGDSVSRTT